MYVQVCAFLFTRKCVNNVYIYSIVHAGSQAVVGNIMCAWNEKAGAFWRRYTSNTSNHSRRINDSIFKHKSGANTGEEVRLRDGQYVEVFSRWVATDSAVNTRGLYGSLVLVGSNHDRIRRVFSRIYRRIVHCGVFIRADEVLIVYFLQSIFIWSEKRALRGQIETILAAKSRDRSDYHAWRAWNELTVKLGCVLIVGNRRPRG